MDVLLVFYNLNNSLSKELSRLAFICSNSRMETPEQPLKSVQSSQERHQNGFK